MKINPNDKVLHDVSNIGPKPMVETITTSFADILSKTAQTVAPQQVAVSQSIQPVVRPTLTSTHEVYRSTERMLDAMALYQNVLADQKASLRDVAPAVDRLKEETVSLEPLLESMDAADPVARIAHEVLITASKEIARFEGGAYVDGP